MKASVDQNKIRVGADIGGTFTDIALDVGETIYSAKVLTDQQSPENAVLDGIFKVTQQAGISLSDLDSIIHGTTLATNALIERRGAKTAFITTEGFRDVIEMRTENRFDQYDLNLKISPPLIPRQHRYPVRGRIDSEGREIQALDEYAVEKLIAKLSVSNFESVAIGFIHSYLNSSHEMRAMKIIQSALPDLPISVSAEVAPQMREYPRFSTVCANAYVRPRIERYLTRLEELLKEEGALCPAYVIHSAGGLISFETAKEFPVRLIESGPAGGVNFAAELSKKFGISKVVSFDMGGTTAKICLIDDNVPETSREFEVARSHRFKKGSGMPILIPVIEMIEIGAGGGSIARVDDMGRLQIGPESAGSNPGPACYQRGGQNATVTDADVVLGKIDTDNFAGGTIQLSKPASVAAIECDVADPLSLDVITGAFGISEMVDENMTNATRVHAVESGKNIAEYVMIAFGGAAPLHAARICEKLNIKQCLIPRGAGVGSAIGFLQTPFSYESVISNVMSLEKFDAEFVNSLLAELIEQAEGFVRIGTQAATSTEITAFMRYQGQGWEIPVLLPRRDFDLIDFSELTHLFEESYKSYFGRTIDVLDDLKVEVVSWSVRVVAEQRAPEKLNLKAGTERMLQFEQRSVFDSSSGKMMECRVYERESLLAGDRIAGPAIIVERETSTFVPRSFEAIIQDDGSILLVNRFV